MQGILIINKPQGYTSQDVVSKVKKILNIKKAGHTGTLDPMATGVLPVLLGEYTKLSKYLIEHDKTYVAKLRLGIKTDTGDIEGVGYDRSVYHITVDVSKVLDGKTVKLKAEATHIHKLGQGDVNADAIDFGNTYTVNDTEEVVIKGHKTLNGRNILSNDSKPLENEFEFEISALTAGAPMPQVTKVKNDANGNFSFPAINYTINEKSIGYDKTYEYKISEVIPANAQNNVLDGVTYTGKEYIVKVNLKDDGFGKITKTVWLDNTVVTTPEVEVSFVNTYSAEGTSVTLSGEKVLNGRGWEDSDEFIFELYETDSSFSTTNQNATLVNNTLKTTKTNKGYSVTLNYEQADRGYHYYVLREVVPADTKGINYDITRYDIIINAADNGKGQMEAHIMSIVNPFHLHTITKDDLDFTNTYKAEDSEPVYIKGTKDIDGKPLGADEFTFELYEADSDFNKGILVDSAKNLADKSFKFAKGLTFDKAGTYYFVVTEKNDGLSYIKYDNTVYGVTIKVVDDGVGKLQTQSPQIVKVATGGNTPATAIEFSNEYNPKEATAVILGEKKLDSEHKNLEADEFEFTISAVTPNAPMPDEDTAKQYLADHEDVYTALVEQLQAQLGFKR